MNYPQPSNPNLMIDPVAGVVNPFGQSGGRTLQGQMRLSF